MTWGTSHFVSRAMAVRYYGEYTPGAKLAEKVATVDRKLKEGSIHIGPPELKPGETLSVIDDGTRYAITSASEKPLDTSRPNAL